MADGFLFAHGIGIYTTPVKTRCLLKKRPRGITRGPMPYIGFMNNARIADVFDQIADLLEFQGANPFRVRAYRNGARTVRDFPEPMARDRWPTPSAS